MFSLCFIHIQYILRVQRLFACIFVALTHDLKTIFKIIKQRENMKYTHELVSRKKTFFSLSLSFALHFSHLPLRLVASTVQANTGESAFRKEYRNISR